MSIPDELLCAEGDLLFAREELASDIELILRGDDYSAEALAHLFINLRQAMASGLEGINRTSNTLRAAIDLTYPHSRAHSAGLKLYRLSLGGHLRGEDEPVTLISSAVERGSAKARAAQASAPVKKGVSDKTDLPQRRRGHAEGAEG